MFVVGFFSLHRPRGAGRHRSIRGHGDLVLPKHVISTCHPQIELMIAKLLVNKVVHVVAAGRSGVVGELIGMEMQIAMMIHQQRLHCFRIALGESLA